MDGADIDLEARLANVHVPVRALTFDSDWLGPAASLRFLLSKLGNGRHSATRLGASDLGAPANHFAWMKQPQAVVNALVDPI